MKKRMISLVGLVCFLLYILWESKHGKEVEEVASYKIDSMCFCTTEGSGLVSRVPVVMIVADNVYEEAVVAKEYIKQEYLEGQYIAYTYEGDFDNDGIKEAFVVIGREEELTENSFFCSLYFVNDELAVQCLAIAVFLDNKPKFQHTDELMFVQFDYLEGIYSVTDIYAVENGRAILQNPGMQSFMDKAVVGEVFTPGADLQARINSAEDFREDSYELRGNYAYKPAMLSAVSLTDATENFTLYLLGRGVMVETPDSEYVYADICYTSNYMVPPELKEMDFDDDGEAELAMITYVLHGTGMGIESLYMVDRDEKGAWKMYYFLPSVYCETFREHFDTVSVEGGVRFCFEGQLVGPVDTMGEDYEIENYEYDVGDQIDFSYGQDDIRMTAWIDGVSAGSMSGLHLYPGGGILSANVEYLGSGKWRLEDIGYRN